MLETLRERRLMLRLDGGTGGSIIAGFSAGPLGSWSLRSGSAATTTVVVGTELLFERDDDARLRGVGGPFLRGAAVVVEVEVVGVEFMMVDGI